MVTQARVLPSGKGSKAAAELAGVASLLSPLERGATGEAALGRSGGCLCLSHNVFHNSYLTLFFSHVIKLFH